MAGTYTEAQYRATMKYREENLKQIVFPLNIHEDTDILASLEESKQHGVKRREWLRNLYDGKDATPSGLCEIEQVEKILWKHRIPPQTIKSIMDALK